MPSALRSTSPYFSIYFPFESYSFFSIILSWFIHIICIICWHDNYFSWLNSLKKNGTYLSFQSFVNSQKIYLKILFAVFICFSLFANILLNNLYKFRKIRIIIYKNFYEIIITKALLFSPTVHNDSKRNHHSI